jgi:hypothetical protein
MKRKLLSGETCFPVLMFVLSCCFLFYGPAASGSEQFSVMPSSFVDPNSQSEPTEELWSLVRSLRQLRTDYYEQQKERLEKIRNLNDISLKLQDEVEELRLVQEQLDNNFSEIQSDIEKLQVENALNKSTESSVLRELERFATQQTEEISNGIPYRTNDRLSRLLGSGRVEQPNQSIGDVLGRVWSFSQEEMRIARSGETFTDMVRLDESCTKYARLFRVGHQVLGYKTEQDGQAGMWISGVGWHKVEKSEAESVAAAIKILDRKSVPKYIQLPIKIEPVKSETKESLD